MTTLTIDFLSKKNTYRRKQASLKNELLAKALGLHKKRPVLPTIIDATAGLGQDSFILAALGFEVTLLERSPTLYNLLAEAIIKGKEDPNVGPILNRLHLLKTDAILHLKSLKIQERPQIIYCDPMFPDRKKTALNKQEMRILHELVGPDNDTNQLIQAALSCATERVVVKRPRLATPLKLPVEPSYSLEGRSNRFDIYLIPKVK